MPPRPLVLFQSFWGRTMDAFIDSAYVSESDQELLSFATTPEEAVTHLRRHLGHDEQV